MPDLDKLRADYVPMLPDLWDRIRGYMKEDV